MTFHPLTRPPARARSGRQPTSSHTYENAKPRPAPRQPSTAKIILVDDDPAVLESLRRVLASEGWNVFATADGADALTLIQTTRPDLVITDLCMMPISGWDLLYHERLEHPELPFFVITALAPKASGGSDSFATQFFQKPLDLDVLLAAIHRELGTSTAPSP